MSSKSIPKGFRLSPDDLARANWAHSFLPDAASQSESEVYRTIFLRGLELLEAEALGLGAEPPPAVSEAVAATRLLPHLLMSLPLLARTGKLSLLGFLASGSPTPTLIHDVIQSLDEAAADAVGELGSEFV